MTGPNQIALHWITCRACGKHGYRTKRAAKTARRQHPHHNSLQVYRCRHTGLIHLGHHRGRTRDQIRYGRKATA